MGLHTMCFIVGRKGGLQLRYEIAELLRCAVNIQHGMLGVRREEQRKAMLAHVDMRIVMRVRAGDVNARQINADVRHVFTVAEERRQTR